MKSHTGQSLFPRLSIQSKQAAVIFSKYIFACTINLFRNHTFPFKPVTKESRVGAYLCFVLTLHKQRITCPHEKISPVLRQGLAQGHKRLIHISYGVLSSFFMSHSWKMPVPCKQTATHHKYTSRVYIYAGEKKWAKEQAKEEYCKAQPMSTKLSHPQSRGQQFKLGKVPGTSWSPCPCWGAAGTVLHYPGQNHAKK